MWFFGMRSMLIQIDTALLRDTFFRGYIILPFFPAQKVAQPSCGAGLATPQKTLLWQKIAEKPKSNY